jgi:hypothetical protein
MALFVGGIADGRTMEVDESSACIVVPHPLGPIVGPFSSDVREIEKSVHYKTDLYFRRRYKDSGLISVRYVYGETHG